MKTKDTVTVHATKEDANMLVKAANCHEKLKEAVRMLLEELDDEGIDETNCSSVVYAKEVLKLK